MTVASGTYSSAFCHVDRASHHSNATTATGSSSDTARRRPGSASQSHARNFVYQLRRTHTRVAPALPREQVGAHDVGRADERDGEREREQARDRARCPVAGPVHRVGRVHERERREQHPRRAHRTARREAAPRVRLARDAVVGLGASPPEPRCVVARDELRVRVVEHAAPAASPTPRAPATRRRAHAGVQMLPSGATRARGTEARRRGHRAPAGWAGTEVDAEARQRRLGTTYGSGSYEFVFVVGLLLSGGRCRVRSPAPPRGRGAAGSGRATSAATSWRRP